MPLAGQQQECCVKISFHAGHEVQKHEEFATQGVFSFSLGCLSRYFMTTVGAASSFFFFIVSPGASCVYCGLALTGPCSKFSAEPLSSSLIVSNPLFSKSFPCMWPSGWLLFPYSPTRGKQTVFFAAPGSAVWCVCVQGRRWVRVCVDRQGCVHMKERTKFHINQKQIRGQPQDQRPVSFKDGSVTRQPWKMAF